VLHGRTSDSVSAAKRGFNTNIAISVSALIGERGKSRDQISIQLAPKPPNVGARTKLIVVRGSIANLASVVEAPAAQELRSRNGQMKKLGQGNISECP
jgi:hypothetical protein